ncbi:MAG TPA: type VI secretion system baseplate subunit TssG [Polyangia bacterium]|nr:type VI secretion system baseplate subunit TssG [Polyangia bacterium]
MADDRGNAAVPLAPEFRSPWDTNVFHEIHRLEVDGPGPSRLGRTLELGADKIRLGQRFSLEPDELAAEPRAATFVQAASLLSSPAPPIVIHRPLPRPPTGAEIMVGEDAGMPRPPRLYDPAFGLLGLWGPMPSAWTIQLERSLGGRARSAEMAALPRSEEGAFARFLDIFHHRLMLARYRAWADARPTTCLDPEGRDPFSLALSAWSGEVPGPPTAGERATGIRDEARARGPASAAALAAIVAERLDAPVDVEELVGEWLTIEPEDRLVLSGDPLTGVIGGGAMLGGRRWERQSRFRLHIGPVDARTLKDLLVVEGPVATTLARLVQRQVGPALRWDAWVRGPGVAAARAGGMGMAQLGRTAIFDGGADAAGLEEWEDRIVDVQGGAVRVPGKNERFLHWAPSARLRDIKEAVEETLDLVFVGAAPTLAAADPDDWPAACSLERALCAATWAALIGARDLATLAADARTEALRWFLDLDHVSDPIPLEGLKRRLATTSRKTTIHWYVRMVLASLRALDVVREPTSALLRRLTGIPD